MCEYNARFCHSSNLLLIVCTCLNNYIHLYARDRYNHDAKLHNLFEI